MRTSAELVCSVTPLTSLSWRQLRPLLLLSFRPVAARPAWYNQASRTHNLTRGLAQVPLCLSPDTHLSRASSQDRTPLLGCDEEQTRTAPCPSPSPPWHSACLTRGSVQKGSQGKVGVGWTGSTPASSSSTAAPSWSVCWRGTPCSVPRKQGWPPNMSYQSSCCCQGVPWLRWR